MWEEEEEEEEEEEGLFKADAVKEEEEEEEWRQDLPYCVPTNASHYRMCSLTIECVLLL